MAAYYGVPFIEASAYRDINHLKLVEIVITDAIRKSKQ